MWPTVNIFLIFGNFVADGLFLLSSSAAISHSYSYDDPEQSEGLTPQETEIRRLFCPKDKNFSFYRCNRGDGFGQQYLCQITALARARHCEGCYRFFGFSPFRSKKIEGDHDDFNAELFTGLHNDSDCNVTGTKWKGGRGVDALFKGTDTKPTPELLDAFFSNEIRDELRNLYWSNAKMDQDSECEVALHDRRGDAIGGDDEEYLRSAGNALIQEMIELNFADKKVCIISQGQANEFGPLQNMANVKLKLGGSTPEAFHDLVMAPVLVKGHSSMSYVAGLLNKGTVYFFPFPGEVQLDTSKEATCDGFELYDWLLIKMSKETKMRVKKGLVRYRYP